jgi:hypothetical protein
VRRCHESTSPNDYSAMLPVTARHSDGRSAVAAPAPVRVQELSRVVQSNAHEGPVYVPGEDALYFTTQRPDVAMKRLALDGRRFPLEPERITTVRLPSTWPPAWRSTPRVASWCASRARSGSPPQLRAPIDHFVAFDVLDGRRLTRGRVLAGSTPEHRDGLKVDAGGRVYASAVEGIRIFDASGDQLGAIALPGAVNFTLGGPEGSVLFITADERDLGSRPGHRRRTGLTRSTHRATSAGAASSAGPSRASPVGSTADDADRGPALEGVRR